MGGIWRSSAGVGGSGFPARPTMDDTPGNRAEGPGSPKPGKMEAEWAKNEGWTCWCGWSGSLDQPHIGQIPPLVILAPGDQA